MILICGIPTEAPTYMVIQAANKIGLPYLVLNQRQLSEVKLNIDLMLTNLAKGWLENSYWMGNTRFERFYGIFNRMMDVLACPK